MTKKKTIAPEYVTREILKEEINRLDTKIDGVEKRLDAKIDSKVDVAVQTMKDYTDSRFTQLNTKIDGVAQKMETRFDKFERYFEQLVGMFVQQNKKIDSSFERLENHEQRVGEIITIHTMVEEHEKRIGVLEEKAG